MSIHSDLVAGGGSPLLLDTHGETVTVRLKNATPVTLTALVGRERTVEKTTPEGRRKIVKERRVTFTTDAASRFGGVEGLPMNATVTYAGTDYAVSEKPSELNGMVAVVLHTSAARRGGGGEYRRT
jgi:hypothetical protein